MNHHLKRGDVIGTVREGYFEHKIMVPFHLFGRYRLHSIVEEGSYPIDKTIARIADEGGKEIPLTMSFRWPVKRPVDCYRERIKPRDPLVIKGRLIDTFYPVAKGGTFCIPGPFGAGKTVLQQNTSRQAEADIVIIAACGERAGEVVETLREFPELEDPRTGKSLMERTIIVCNTSSMPVASREASVYTAVTMGEYYRQMGYDVLLLADSTSRWAQAMREMSGRLEEIPGEEAFPAYLESVIASFYERAGRVRCYDGSVGSVTIGGTVSPAGGNFDEPVTQATLKVVGAFLGLSRERSDARKYPAIDPLESWSKYPGLVEAEKVKHVRELLRSGNEVSQMMKVVGEEGTTIEDYVIYLKSELVDDVYLQQDSFNPKTAAVSPDRQRRSFELLREVLDHSFHVDGKDEARRMFQQLRLKFLDYNLSEWMSEEFQKIEEEIRKILSENDTDPGETDEEDTQ